MSLDRTLEVPRLQRGHIHRARHADIRGGGKGVNVARALRCVGVDAPVIGFSAGHTGHAVLGLLADEGIDVFSVRSGGETRSCLTVLSSGDVTVFNESGSPIDAESWGALEAEVAARLRPETVFVCSGSFPPGAPSDGAARLVTVARGLVATTICDTSSEQLRAALGAAPDLVAPNLAEAETVLGGGEEEPVDAGEVALDRAAGAASALAARGAAAVLVTAGAAGAVLVSGRDPPVALPAHEVEVVNPVGAGDCLVAGIALGVAAGRDLVASARRGMAMAAAGCESFAAGMLDPGRVDELLRQG
jgi:1-phosphofructokinase family hexose kinase